MTGWIYVLPLFSALLGWLISKFAENYFFKIHLPANKAGLASRLASNELIPFEVIEQKLASSEGMKKLMPVIELHIDDFLRNKLVKSMPVVGMFIGEKTIGQLKDIFLQEMEAIFPTVMSTYFNNIRQELDLKQLVAERLDSMPPGQFESHLRLALRKQLRLFGVLGAATGFIVGLFQLGMTLALH